MTERTAIIHIGLPKTGSTAIQNFLMNNSELLREHGAYFATAPGPRNHAMLATYALGGRARRGLLRRASKLSSDKDEFESLLPSLIETELQNLPESIKTVIYSSEMLGYSIRKEEYAERLRSLFAPHFSDMRIVIYLRRQDEAAVSAYSTQLRAGGQTRFNIIPEDDTTHRYQYNQVLEVFEAGFGRECIYPRIFDRKLMVGGDVVKDFIAACGIEGLELPEDSSVLVRGSAFRADVQEFLRRFNNLMDEQNLPGRKSIASIVGSTAPRGAPRLPTRQEAQDFYEKFREGNEIVRARYFPDRPTLFNEDFSRYPEEADQDAYSDTRVLEIALAVLTKVAPQLGKLEVDMAYVQGRLAEARGRMDSAKQHYVWAAQSPMGHEKARAALARMKLKPGDLPVDDEDDTGDESVPDTGSDASDGPASPSGAGAKKTTARKEDRRKRRAEVASSPSGKRDRKSRRVAKKAKGSSSASSK